MYSPIITVGIFHIKPSCHHQYILSVVMDTFVEYVKITCFKSIKHLKVPQKLIRFDYFCRHATYMNAEYGYVNVFYYPILKDPNIFNSLYFSYFRRFCRKTNQGWCQSPVTSIPRSRKT